MRMEAKCLLASDSISEESGVQKLAAGGKRTQWWLTCVDDVADSTRAQGVIEWDHHHRIRVAGKLCDDPLWRHTGVGVRGGEQRAYRKVILPLCPGNRGT